MSSLIRHAEIIDPSQLLTFCNNQSASAASVSTESKNEWHEAGEAVWSNKKGTD